VVKPPTYPAPPAHPVVKHKPPIIIVIIWKILTGGRR
jgi:hypothetical protein